jgi:transcriptional/translational regulatory protein YebC/TACO1
MNKDIEGLVKKIKKAEGWRVEKSKKNGHYMAYAPDSKKIIVIGSTISDSRAIKKIKAHLNRAGLIIH